MVEEDGVDQGRGGRVQSRRSRGQELSTVPASDSGSPPRAPPPRPPLALPVPRPRSLGVTKSHGDIPRPRTSGTSSRVEKALQQSLGTDSQDDGREGQPGAPVRASGRRSATTRRRQAQAPPLPHRLLRRPALLTLPPPARRLGARCAARQGRAGPQTPRRGTCVCTAGSRCNAGSGSCAGWGGSGV